jgi:GT2 family glycosyltransferase
LSPELIDATVIVVSYDKLPYTRLCLEGLLQCSPRPAQIVVVDNGSHDGSMKYLMEEFPPQCRTKSVDCVLLSNDTNRGACTARNQALEKATGNYLAFADNDLAVRSGDWLAVLARRLESRAEIGIVGPQLVYPFAPYDIECAGVALSPSGRVQYRGRGEPRCGNAASGASGAAPWCQAGPVQCLISACWLMRRAVYEQVGPLDEVFNPAQFEDFDFCYRARQAGWEVWYEPAAEMYHFENTTTAGSVDMNFRYVTIRNGLEFKRRWLTAIAQEGGPSDEECRWRDLPTHPLEETGPPPLRESRKASAEGGDGHF